MATSDDGQGGDFRRNLARLVQQLIEEGHASRAGGEPAGPLVSSHLGGVAPGADLRIYTEELEGWELPNLQLALDEVVGRSGWSARAVGLGGHARHYSGFGLGLLLTSEYITLARRARRAAAHDPGGFPRRWPRAAPAQRRARADGRTRRVPRATSHSRGEPPRRTADRVSRAA